MSKILAPRYNIVSNMRRYRKQLQKFILLFYLLFLSPHHKYLALFVFSLISVFSIPLPQHTDHQRPPLDVADLTKATTWHHRSSVFSILLRVLFFLFLFCSLFLAVVWCVDWAMGGFGWVDWWWVDSDGQIVVHHAAPSTSYSQVTDLWCQSLCFLLFLFFYGSGFSVLLWWF